MIDQDFLGNEIQSGRGAEPSHVEGAFGIDKLHQVDRCQVARRVVQEHVFAARIGRVDRTRVRTRVPTIDRGVVLHAGVAAMPRTFGHLAEQFLGVVGRRRVVVLVADPSRLPRSRRADRFHVIVGQPHRKVGVLETNAAVGFTVEVRLVTFADQRVGLLFLLPFALDELEHVGVPDFERLHLGGTPRFSAAFDDAGDRVVNPHERKRARGGAPARKFFAMAADGRQIGAGAAAELEQHRLAGRQPHDVFHVVIHALDETCRALRKLVRVIGLGRALRCVVPVPIARIADDAVLVKQPDVEPNGAVERAVLMQTQIRQVAIKPIAVGRGVEIPVGQSPIGNRSRHPVNQLADAALTFVRIFGVAIEVFRDHDVGGQLRPCRRDLAIGLFEQCIAGLVLDGSRTQFPIDSVERRLAVDGTKDRIDLQTRGAAAKPRPKLGFRVSQTVFAIDLGQTGGADRVIGGRRSFATGGGVCRGRRSGRAVLGRRQHRRHT